MDEFWRHKGNVCQNLSFLKVTEFDIKWKLKFSFILLNDIFE